MDAPLGRNIKLTSVAGVGSCCSMSTPPPPRSSTVTISDSCSQLIRSPTFNRAVHKVYRKINKIPDHEPKNGLGRMSIQSLPKYKQLMIAGTGPSAFDHFKDEVKTQFKDLTWQKRDPRK